MTTLVALSTKDALVMGCDSLGSVSRDFIDTLELFRYFDPENDWQIRQDSKGKPLLQNVRQLMDFSESIPYIHMTHVSKLFSLEPLPMGIMTSGISSIANRTIKSLISEFKRTDKAFIRTPTNFTVRSIGERIKDFIYEHYQEEYPEDRRRPSLEFLIGGYDKQSPIPAIYRIDIPKNEIIKTIEDFGVVFGGQMQEIQRIVFGTDFVNKIRIAGRSTDLLYKYYQYIEEHLKNEKVDVVLPLPTEYPDLYLFHDFDLEEFSANWEDFSEQNAIECVDFFINIMIKSQQFSARLPTVGGDIHIALITKDKGFRHISGDELRHGEHTVEL